MKFAIRESLALVRDLIFPRGLAVLIGFRLHDSLKILKQLPRLEEKLLHSKGLSFRLLPDSFD